MPGNLYFLFTPEMVVGGCTGVRGQYCGSFCSECRYIQGLIGRAPAFFIIVNKGKNPFSREREKGQKCPGTGQQKTLDILLKKVHKAPAFEGLQ